MSRSYKYNPDEQDTSSDTLFDDSQLSTGDVQISANSGATGDLSVTRQLSSKARKRADKQFRKQRRHDDRL
jgi:hypothetical protein